MSNENIGIVMTVDGVLTLTNGMKLSAAQIDEVGKALDKTSGKLDTFNAKTKVSATEQAALVAAQRRTAETFGLTKTELMAYEAKAAGLTGTNARLSDSYIQQGKAMEAVKTQQDEIISMSKRVGLAVGLAAFAFTAHAISAAKNAAELSVMSDRTGQATETLAALQYVAGQTDVNFNSLIKDMQTLPKIMQTYRGEFSDTGRALAALGIKKEDVTDTVEGLKLIADRVTEIKDPMTQAATLTALFLQNGEELLPFFKQGADGITKMMADGRLYAQVTDEQGQATRALTDEIDKYKAQSESASRVMSQQFIPLLTQLTTEALKAGGSFDVFALAGDGIRVMLETVSVVGGNVAYVLKQTGNEVGGIAAQVAAVVRGDFAGAAAIRSAMLEDANKAREDIDAFEKRVMTAAAKSRQSAEALRAGAGLDTRVEDRRFGVVDRTAAARAALGDPKPKTSGGLAAVSDPGQAYLDQLKKQYRDLNQETSAYSNALDFLARNTAKLKDGQDGQIKAQALMIDQARGRKAASDAEIKAFAEVQQAREASGNAWLDEQNRMREGFRDQEFEISLLGKTTEQVVRLTAAYKDQKAADARRLAVNSDPTLSPDDIKSRLATIDDDAARQMASRGVLLADQFRPGWQKMIDGYQNTWDLIKTSHDTMMGGMLRAGEDAFVQFAKTGKLSVRGMVDVMIEEMARLTYRKNLAGPLSDLLSTGLKFLTGGGTGAEAVGAARIGMNHTGGIAGVADASYRMVNPAVFAGAPRFHTGGIAGNEVPIIAQRGEGIFTREQMANLSPAGGAQPVTVNVINQNGSQVDVQQKQAPGGGLQLDVIISQLQDALADNVAAGAGSLTRAMEGRFGLRTAVN